MVGQECSELYVPGSGADSDHNLLELGEVRREESEAGKSSERSHGTQRQARIALLDRSAAHGRRAVAIYPWC